jgi:hypothetical protein
VLHQQSIADVFENGAAPGSGAALFGELPGKGSTSSNTAVASRSSRASTTLFDKASAMTIKWSGVIVFSMIGPPGRIWSSLSGASSMSTVSSSGTATP